MGTPRCGNLYGYDGLLGRFDELGHIAMLNGDVFGKTCSTHVIVGNVNCLPIDIIAIDMENDSTANVEYKISVLDKDGNIDTETLKEEDGHGILLVKKVDSKWLAHQPKESAEEDLFDDFSEMEEEEEIRKVIIKRQNQSKKH